ncbi:MAG: hypothetical protein LBH09_08175 [Peptococcaceae bacterium]|nr:hypothetical protein [Peptococcaceae bacterium]
MYNSIVVTHEELEAIEKGPYYTQRLSEAQLAEARAEAEIKGEAKGKAEGKAEGEAIGKVKGATLLAELIKKGYELDVALKMIKEGSGI